MPTGCGGPLGGRGDTSPGIYSGFGGLFASVRRSWAQTDADKGHIIGGFGFETSPVHDTRRDGSGHAEENFCLVSRLGMEIQLCRTVFNKRGKGLAAGKYVSCAPGYCPLIARDVQQTPGGIRPHAADRLILEEPPEIWIEI